MRNIIILAVIALLSLQSCFSQVQPIVLIYSPGAPDYGHELEQLIVEDTGVDADILVLEDPDLLKMLIHFPNIKAVVVPLAVASNEGIGPSLEWFFSEGGGLIGMGFAGYKLTTGNASETVFPLFGNSYKSGKYDTKTKTFTMTHLKEEEDEISEGVSDFTLSAQKLFLSMDPHTGKYLPRFPDQGEYKVLFREEGTGAPSMIKSENKGVSITFACFGGDDFERGVNYFGRFTNTTEFRKLFTNSFNWIWANENKYEAAISEAKDYFERREQEILEYRDAADKIRMKVNNARLIRTVLTITFAAGAITCVYWITFVRGQSVEKNS